MRNNLSKFIFTLNESSFFDINDHNIVTKTLINRYIEDDYDLLDTYIASNKIIENEKDAQKSKEYYEFVKKFLLDQYEEVKETLFYKIDDYNLINIYRALTVPDNWIDHLKTQGKRLGIYWTWDPIAAITHWGFNKHKNTAIITAKINEKYIDWKTTFEYNMDPNYMEEKEIRLYKNTPINIISIEINNANVDLDFLKNKTLYS